MIQILTNKIRISLKEGIELVLYIFNREYVERITNISRKYLIEYKFPKGLKLALNNTPIIIIIKDRSIVDIKCSIFEQTKLTGISDLVCLELLWSLETASMLIIHTNGNNNNNNITNIYCSFNQDKYFSNETDSITIGIELCNIPHISEHCPKNVPSRFTRTETWFNLPG